MAGPVLGRPPSSAPTAVDFDALRASTLPGLLLERARARPHRVAYRSKELGIYRETTWRTFAERVAAVALGLEAEFGIAQGDAVAILGDPCPEWTIADLAAQALGAVTYGIYPTSSPSEVRHLLLHGGAVLVVAEDQEHLDKTLAVLPDCPRVRAVVLIDTRARFVYERDAIHAFAELEARGRERLAAEPRALAQRVAALRPDDPATIVYTSGTTAHPKGALYRHGAHAAACGNILAHYPSLLAGEHRVVAMLPLCHTMGRDIAITMPLIADIVPHYPESIDTVAETMYEIAPTFVFTVPRYLQKFAAHLLVGIDASSPAKRWAYRAAVALARRTLARRQRGGRSTPLALADALARALVFRWLLEKVGLARTRLVLSSGAPLPREVGALWQLWGVNLCEVYGQTETGGGLISGQRAPLPRPGDVGPPVPNTEIRLSRDAEVLVRAPDLFAGYWRDSEATRAAFDDGWLRTGDVGEWTPDGALRLVDRQKDLLITAGGKNVSPSQVESHLRASPFVSEAVVVGEGRKYLAALLELDAETVAEWARAHGVLHTGYASLVGSPEVLRLIEGEVGRANAHLARVEQVKAFRVLPRELDPEQEGEPVTPTRKVKRRLMFERYRDLIESMYASDEERRITAEVAGLVTED
ncbi:MAG: long-chain fatty acid--CoA ligase [Candidatus Rokubacteria bacterium]|nr:long-chain fatty acid--CoA ligase [Candidatus Rokubacteria bacterium]